MNVFGDDTCNEDEAANNQLILANKNSLVVKTKINPKIQVSPWVKVDVVAIKSKCLVSRFVVGGSPF